MSSKFLGTIFLLAAALPVRAGGPSPAWLDQGWDRRLPLSLATPPDSVLHDVVLLVDGSSASAIFAEAKNDGSDLRVTRADGVSLLAHHLVAYDAGAQELELWLEASSLGPANSQFYVYFANAAAASTSNPADTWSGFDAVFLFEGTPGGTLTDVSGKGNHAARVSGPWNAGHRVDGKIGRAWNYGGGRTMGVWGKQITQGGTWTVSAWARATSRSTDFLLQGNPCYFSLHIQASNISWDAGQYKNDYCPSLGWSIRTNQNVGLNDWHHHSWSADGVDSLLTYNYDGQRVAYNVQTDRNFPNVAQTPNIKWRVHPIGSTQEGVGIGSVMYTNNQDDMDGDVDHFTIRSVEIPAKLLAIEHANQAAPQGFWIAGAVQNRPGTPTLPSSFGGMKSRFESEN